MSITQYDPGFIGTQTPITSSAYSMMHEYDTDEHLLIINSCTLNYAEAFITVRPGAWNKHHINILEKVGINVQKTSDSM